MNYRPYPDVDRALAQVERHQTPNSQPPLLTSLAQFQAAVESGEFTRRMAALVQSFAATMARRAGKTAITPDVPAEPQDGVDR